MSLKKSLAVVALLTFVITTSASAQDAQTPTATSGAPAATDAAPVIEQITLENRTAVDYTSMLGALDDVAGRIKDYNAVKGKTVKSFQLVNVRSLMKEADADAYTQTVTVNQKGIDYLRNVVGKVALTSKVLTENNVTTDKVVAMDVLANGNVVIYYDDPNAEGQAQN